jgi:hypothetical protein
MGRDRASKIREAPPLHPVDRRGRSIDLRPVRPLLDQIVSRWHPRQVWLFGSRARGDARPESDWDLLVVVPDETPDSEFDPLIGWQFRKSSGVPGDVFPCRASEFMQDQATCNTLSYDAAHDGVLIHEQ